MTTTTERRQRALMMAEQYGGVLSRRLLRSIGADDRMIRRETAAQRWRCHGRQTVAVHLGPLSPTALRWRAVWEVGESIARLDGVSSLQQAGMTGYVDDEVHVSVVHRHDVVPVAGVRIHKVIRRAESEGLDNGIPRVRPEVAAIRAAHWAVSERQAALVLCMPVQQRLITGEQLLASRRRVRGRNRRAFIDQVVRDVADGAQSLGELDFASDCRKRGLPEPDRQEIRYGPRGVVYLDVRWRNGLVLEIDGAAHRQGLAVAEDHLRANAVSLTEDTVLRIDLVGYRIWTEDFLDQVCTGYWLRQRRSA